MAVILDLDQTLVDSSLAEAHRDKRDWPRVYSVIPQFTVYEGIADVLKTLRDNNVPVCVVTSSPSSYCSKVISHFDWGITTTVCYHDTAQRKPHPAPILAGLARMKVAAEDAVSVGDLPKDIVASKAANVYAVAATWGAANEVALLATSPDAVVRTPDALKHLLIARLPSLAHLG